MQTIRIMKIKMEEVLGTDGMKEIGDKLNRVIRLINKTSFCIDPFEEREK